MSTLAYDADDNMTTEDNGDTIKYDPWNQFTVDKTGGTTNLIITRTARGLAATYNNGNLSDFFQDAAGRLIEFGTTTVHEDFVWGQAYVNEEVLRDRDYDGNHGTGNYGAAGSGLEERVYDQYDANYDTTSTFATGGTSLGLQERFVYDPYGACTQLDGSWNVSTDPHHWYWNFKFQGEWQESFGNLYAMGARSYNFTTGTWMQKDPIGTGDGMDVYQGFGGNPVNAVDPMGLAWEILKGGNGPTTRPTTKPTTRPTKPQNTKPIEGLQNIVDRLNDDDWKIRAQALKDLIYVNITGGTGEEELIKQCENLPNGRTAGAEAAYDKLRQQSNPFQSKLNDNLVPGTGDLPDLRPPGPPVDPVIQKLLDEAKELDKPSPKPLPATRPAC